MVGLDYFGDHADQRHRCEEFAVIVRFEVGELRQEIFVDAAEDVATRLLEFVRVERAQQLTEHIVVEFGVLALGQHALETVVIFLDGFHCVLDIAVALGAVRPRH
jgi:hypothetical protein